MPNYDALKNKQQELVRKSLDGSAFVAPISSAAVTSLTQFSGSPNAAVIVGSAAATNITTGGLLKFEMDGVIFGVVLAAADTPASVVTKINDAVDPNPASLVGGALQLQSGTTGVSSHIKVISGAGTVLADLKLTAGQEDWGQAGVVDLKPLPAGYDDLGWLTSDGMQFSRDVSASEITSFGSVSPTRTDITSDTTTLTVTAQETKLLTIGMATGADLTNVVPTLNTGEVSIAKPVRPTSKYYRVLALSVDQGDAGEIYIARFLPRAKVTSYSEQSFANGDEATTWGVTLTGEADSALGYSERWIFGGLGWKALLTDMGFPPPA